MPQVQQLSLIHICQCHEDFAVALYPGHLHTQKGTLNLNPDIASHITAQTPPTFLLQNEDDHVDTIWDALSLSLIHI